MRDLKKRRDNQEPSAIVRIPGEFIQTFAPENEKKRGRNDNDFYAKLIFRSLFVVVACVLLLRMSSSSKNNFVSKSNNSKSKNKNKNKKINLAVLVAGSTSRFLFDSFVEHVVKPCPSNVEINYFAVLTLNSGPAFRQADGYMGHLAGRDELFKDIPVLDPESSNARADVVENSMREVMTKTLSKYSKTTTTTVALRALRVLDKPMEDSPILQELMTREANKQKNSENGQETIDLYQQFPMKDLRPNALTRTKAGNKNIIRLFLALESLYKTEFKNYEKQLLSSHDDNNGNNGSTVVDYVLILRDDTLWLDDFDFNRVIESDPDADAYILSCDARLPTLLSPEINDHGILIKRSKADVVGSYVTSMSKANLDGCHSSVESFVGANRGCNSEMILKYILEQEHSLNIKLVPQSLLPFQRAVLIKGDNDKDKNNNNNYYCYHKFCQSIDDPLKLPTDIQKCKELKF